MNLDDWIKSIQELIPSVIVLGGYSRFKQGLEKEYTKTWIDVSVPNNNSLEPLKSFGRLTHFESDFQSAVTDRYTWKSPQGFYLDIFVNSQNTDYIIVDNLKCVTLDQSIKFVEEYIQEMGSNPYMEAKLTKLKNLI